jgi:hypothetical protein
MQGHESYAALGPADCSATYDYGDTIQALEAQSHTFPTGLPMASVGVYNGVTGIPIFVSITGYLIPAAQLPPDTPESRGPIKGMAGR